MIGLMSESDWEKGGRTFKLQESGLRPDGSLVLAGRA